MEMNKDSRRTSWNVDRFKRVVRYWYVRFLRLQGTPQAIARGLACGVFSGCFPFFGFQILIGIALAIILRGNKIAAAAGTWISNPFTYLPIFAFNYKIGSLLLGENQLSEISINSNSDLMTLGATTIGTLSIGSFVVGLITAIITYFASLRLICSCRKSRAETQRRREQFRKIPTNKI